MMGWLMDKGLGGLAADPVESMELYKKAAADNE